MAGDLAGNLSAVTLCHGSMVNMGSGSGHWDNGRLDDMLGGVDGHMLCHILAVLLDQSVDHGSDLGGALLLLMTNLLLGTLRHTAALLHLLTLLLRVTLLHGVAHVLGDGVALLVGHLSGDVVTFCNGGVVTLLLWDTSRDGVTVGHGVSVTTLLWDVLLHGGALRNSVCRTLLVHFSPV